VFCNFLDTKQLRKLLYSQQRLSNEQTTMAGGRCACEEKGFILLSYFSTLKTKSGCISIVTAFCCLAARSPAGAHGFGRDVAGKQNYLTAKIEAYTCGG
jgi:hypothetical protein